MSQQQNDEERKCIGRGWNTMRGHPPVSSGTAQHSDCLSSSTRDTQEQQQDSFCVIKGGSGWPLLQQNQRQAQYSQVLESAHQNAWNSYSQSSMGILGEIHLWLIGPGHCTPHR